MTRSSKQAPQEINVEKLPSIPHTLIKLIEAFQDHDVDFKQISDIIQNDPTLTSKMLSVANSAAFSQCHFKDFEHILVVLGMDRVKTIATSAAVQQFFSQFNTDENGHIGRFWLTSLHAAYFSKAVAHLVGYPYIDEAYLGGLIHQIGQLVFLSQYYDDYAPILEKCKDSQELKEKELELFGFTSATLGSKLVNSWQTESMLEDAILYQEADVEHLFDTPLLIRIVNLAHRFGVQMTLAESDKPLFFDQAFKLFGLTQASIEQVFQEIQEDIKATADGLGVELSDDHLQIVNQQQYSLSLASQVKDIAMSGAINLDSTSASNSAPTDDKPEQIVSNIMQNFHILFGLSRCLYFTYDSEQSLLVCQAENIQSPIDLNGFNIGVEPARSLLARTFSKRAIHSSLENQQEIPNSIVDQQLIRLLKTDGILCIPLFESAHFYGVLVAGFNQQQYPQLLQQRRLIGELTRTAAQNISRYFAIQAQQQSTIEQANSQQHLHIRKLIHEANNPLAIITNYLQILSMKMQDGNSDEQQISSQIHTLQGEVERVGNILLRMKEPPDHHDILMGNTNINLLINELISVFQSSLFATHQIMETLKLDESIPAIQCDRDGIKQVLINLIKNAAEAMPEGGILEIETHDQINMNGKQYIELVISDTGPGMSDEVLANLFSPVKTTKGENHSGLGLSISKNIVDKLGGTISCHNRGNGGVKFVILLPRIIPDEKSDHAEN